MKTKKIDAAIDEVVQKARELQAETGGDPDYRRFAEEALNESVLKLKKLISED